MNDERRLSWTRWFVLAGILLSYLSYGTAKLGWGELFPFAHWRLYSAPVGINEEATTFRIYVLDDGSQTWSRLPLESSPGFTRKEQAYVINHSANQLIDNPSDDDARLRLRTAAETLAPRARSYRIVAETFFSLPLYADSTQYDTSTVARFGR